MDDNAKNINIAFTSTAYGPMWAKPMSSWLNCVAYTSRQCAIRHIGKLGGSGITDRMYTHSAENRLVEQFLEDKSFTHLFMTEMDMVLPHDAIVKLLAMDKSLASGVYFLRSDAREGVGQPCLYKRPAASDPLANQYGHCAVSLFPIDEPFAVDCAGLGCLLIKREVFEGPKAIKYPWFDLKEKGYGSDIYFSKHVRDAGFELWVDPTVSCGQVDYYEMTIDDWKWQLETNPKFAKYGFIIGAPEIKFHENGNPQAA